jgi:hypothetical protein
MSGRVLVFGSRGWSDLDVLGAELAAVAPAVVIEGEAAGADRSARMWARGRGIPVERFPADWSQGRGAGPIRNAQMLRVGKPDRAVGFVVGLAGSKASRGSADMYRQCVAAGVPVVVYRDGGALEIDPAVFS